MNRIEKLKSKVSHLYELKNEGRGDWADWLYEHHVFLVADLAEKLADRYGTNKEITVAASMLHDIADAVMNRYDPRHEEESFKIARNFLKESDFTDKEIKIIIEDVMRLHGCHDGEKPKTLEGKVMASADGIVHLQSDFYDHALRNMDRTEFLKWAIPKIDRDFNNKILFDDLQNEIRPVYEKLLAKFANK